MMITKQTIVHQLTQYLHKDITLEKLVEWSENCMMNETFDEHHYDEIRHAIAQLGVADVRAFGLTWEDCEQILNSLGYSAHVEITSN